MTVLLVEDDKKRREQIKAFLESDTVQVIAVDNAHQALRIMHKTSIDHLLSDLNLDDIDGLWLSNELKKESVLFARVKKLLYSSRPIIDDLKDLAYRMGVDMCLTSTDAKGISEEALNYLKR